MFYGDALTLAMLESAVALIPDADQARWTKSLKKQIRVKGLRDLLNDATISSVLSGPGPET